MKDIIVHNPNLLLGTEALTYRFRLFDANNVLIALREGKTFINPREKFLIFEEGIETIERIPTRATVEFTELAWKRIERERPQLLIIRKDFSNTPAGGRLIVFLKNEPLFPVEDITLAAALLNEDNNAIGVSTTRLDFLGGEAEREVFFTWRESFDPAPVIIEVLVRTDLTE